MFIVTSSVNNESLKIQTKEGAARMKEFWQSYGASVRIKEVEDDGTGYTDTQVDDAIRIATDLVDVFDNFFGVDMKQSGQSQCN